MQRGNGAVIGKQNTPTTSVATGVWALNEVQRAVLNGTWPALAVPDPYFENVTMLLHGDGTNGAQNNTFLDSSTNNFTITRNGNTTQGTFTPYGSNWSNYFNGSSSLSANVSGVAAGTSTFTFEVWVFLNAYPGSDAPFYDTRSSNGASTTGMQFGVYSTGALKFYDGTETNLGGTVPLNQWVHIALVRNGSNVVTPYINGTATGTTVSSTRNFSDNYFWIGSVPGPASPYINAYFSNLRWVVGTAVYTSNFTPSTTPLTAITNTKLLTCQSNRFIDNSSNAFTITVNGSPSVQRFSPFSPTASYTAATIGGSGYWDGTGDYLTVADNIALDMESSDFTIEGWIFPVVSSGGSVGIFSKRASGAVVGGVLLYYNGAGLTPSLLIGSGGSWVINQASSIAFTLGQWNHFAVVRNGTSFVLYINGVAGVSATSSSSVTDNSAAFAIGAWAADGTGIISASYFSNFRVVKGTAVYTSAFTPPTAPLTAITNTSLLLNFTNGGIIDNAEMNDLETVGNAQISTSVKKFGTGSLYFDGSGDGLFAASSPNLAFGSGDFTVEGWVYFTANLPYLDGDGLYSAAFFGQTGTNGLALVFKSGGSSGTPTSLVFSVIGVGSASTTVSIALNTWYHIAVSKSSGTVRVFVNGVQQNSFSNSTTFAQSVGTVGYLNIASFNDWFPGYIDDFRITKGVARYTANFTAPTAPFPDF